ncbi:MAG: hypothetical protein ABEJ35_04940 [Halobacteriaceae archaeon]
MAVDRLVIAEWLLLGLVFLGATGAYVWQNGIPPAIDFGFMLLAAGAAAAMMVLGRRLSTDSP